MLEELGIEVVKLNLPFRLNHVNCFMAQGDNGWTIIDAGLNNCYTKAAWQEKIKGKNITNIFLTHSHPDHFGCAGELQNMTGAKVSMTKLGSESAFESFTAKNISNLNKNYKKSGVPIEVAKLMVNNTKSFKKLTKPHPIVGNYFTEGQKVSIGQYEYEVIFTPGHSEGMICFYNTDKNVLISADHILPRISPNISYWFRGDPNPLQSYITSLMKIEKLHIDFVIPSHGLPFNDANKRISELLLHHEERLTETLSVIDSYSTVHEICNKLFDFKLTVHESRFALGETLAHLEYLRSIGKCEKKEINEEWIYYKN